MLGRGHGFQRHRPAGSAGAVVRVDGIGACHHGHDVSTDTGGDRFDDAHHRIGRDRGVDGAPAGTKHGHRCGCGRRMPGSHGAEGFGHPSPIKARYASRDWATWKLDHLAALSPSPCSIDS